MKLKPAKKGTPGVNSKPNPTSKMELLVRLVEAKIIPWAFCKNNSFENYFCKKVHLECLIGFQICLCTLCSVHCKFTNGSRYWRMDQIKLWKTAFEKFELIWSQIPWRCFWNPSNTTTTTTTTTKNFINE